MDYLYILLELPEMNRTGVGNSSGTHRILAPDGLKARKYIVHVNLISYASLHN